MQEVQKKAHPAFNHNENRFLKPDTVFTNQAKADPQLGKENISPHTIIFNMFSQSNPAETISLFFDFIGSVVADGALWSGTGL